MKAFGWIAKQQPQAIATGLSQPLAQLTGSFTKLFPEQGQAGPLVSINLLTVEQPQPAIASTVEHAPMLDLPE